MSYPIRVHRRAFCRHVGATLLAPSALRVLGAANGASPESRTLGRVGIQLYTLRDDARRDLDATLAAIAAAGYRDVEMLG